MIDLHSHLLPGVDDGSRTVEQSVGVLEVFKLRGVHIVAATTLTMPRSRGDRARDLVRAEVAGIPGTDNHGDTRCVATALDWRGDHDGAEQAEILLDANPRAILEDRALFAVDPLPVHEGLWSRVRRLFGEARDV